MQDFYFAEMHPESPRTRSTLPLDKPPLRPPFPVNTNDPLRLKRKARALCWLRLARRLSGQPSTAALELAKEQLARLDIVVGDGQDAKTVLLWMISNWNNI